MVPEFESSVEVEASSKESEHPLNQKYLRLDAIALHFLIHCRLVIFEQKFKGSTGSLNKVILQTERFPQEGVTKYEIAEEVKGSHLAKNRYENDRRIRHSLNIANIRPEDMKNLKKLADIRDKTIFSVVLRLAIERPLDVFVDLYFNFLAYPVLLSSIQQL